MKINSKRKRIIGVALLLVAVCLLTLYCVKDRILNHYVAAKMDTYAAKHALQISYQDLHFEGFSELVLSDLSVVPAKMDTLLTVKQLSIDLSLFDLLKGDLNINQFHADQLYVRLIQKKGIANYHSLLQSKSDQEVEKQRVGYADKAKKTLHFLFNLLPANLKLTLFQVDYVVDENRLSLSSPVLQTNNHFFDASMSITENGIVLPWRVKGEIDKKAHACAIKLYSATPNATKIPFLESALGAKVACDTLSFALTGEESRGDEMWIKGVATVSGLSVDHSSLSSNVIVLQHGELDFQFNLKEHVIELDSCSKMTVNALTFNPYLSFSTTPATHIVCSVNRSNLKADALFSSFPKGLFANLEGIQTSGLLKFHFLVDLDFQQLDSLVLESELTGTHFQILKQGKTDLRKMNQPFSHSIYENEKFVRTIEIGEVNPSFRTLAQISPLLQMAVLQSEDGAFYRHQGFLIDCTKEALIHDLKVKKFARGGSTISMQLVKNVFLNRNKTFARKLEEALIVWLIEQNKITSKERMYEVYLNLIEWGPNVYGIYEASHFYFSKEPIDLTVNEAIFLASIVPKPKRFKVFFDDQMKLHSFTQGYFRIIAKRLLAKNVITPEEEASISPDITLTGDAKNYFESQIQTNDADQ